MYTFFHGCEFNVSMHLQAMHTYIQHWLRAADKLVWWQGSMQAW